VPVVDYSGVSSDTGTLRAVAVPVGLTVVALHHSVLTGTDSGGGVEIQALITSASQANTAASTTLCTVRVPNTGTTVGGTSLSYVVTNTSAQIRTRLNISNGTPALSGMTQGWLDRRGQDGGL
jgi:hypothetical protein